MKCSKCNEDFEEREIHEHHVHPKFMDNIRGDGNKIDLCQKDHTILHMIIPSIIWKYIPSNLKMKCVKEVERFTYDYLSKKEAKKRNWFEKEEQTIDIEILRYSLNKGLLFDKTAFSLIKNEKEWKQEINLIAENSSSKIITSKEIADFKFKANF